MQRKSIITGLAVLGAAALAWWRPWAGSVPRDQDRETALVGEARQGGLSMALPDAISDVPIMEAKRPGEPLVLIDPGHGGADGGAVGQSGRAIEKNLTLAMARQLRDRLAEMGRVRVALTRDDDSRLTLEQRAAIARRIGADLLVSIHMDSAPNPAAAGVTIYSLADVASTEEAASLAEAERERVGPVVSDGDDAVSALLTDLALRDQMEASARFAKRFLRRAGTGVPLRPTPHQFANFHVLRRSQAPGVLVEAGYISNVGDEARLTSAEARAPLVAALADAIEADLAARTR